jgi:four helix bundle protein
MSEIQNGRHYDLEDRTFAFARSVRSFVKRLPNTVANQEDGRQVIRSSGSTGANYIEANESLSKKDFALRIKICRKEAKESRYWLRLLDVGKDEAVERERLALVQEGQELMNIFGAILKKTRED